MPETTAALRKLAELLDDDASESAEDGAAAAAATAGASDCNTEAAAVAGAAEEEDFGLFPTGQAAETQTAEMAKGKAWSFMSSKRTCAIKCARIFDIKRRRGVYPLTKVRNAGFGWRSLGQKSDKNTGRD